MKAEVEDVEDIVTMPSLLRARKFLVADESRFNGLSETDALALAKRERTGEVEVRMVEITWDALEEANDPETMAEIACLRVGEATTLGMCDPIERVS